MASFGSLKSAIFDREERKQQYQAHILGLRPPQKVRQRLRFYGREASSQVKLPVKTDHDTVREGYQFIRSEEDDMDQSREQRLVKRYYEKLFKEYCMTCHITRVVRSVVKQQQQQQQQQSLFPLSGVGYMNPYEKIGLRWRTEKEVTSGKGNVILFIDYKGDEAGENKQALVKLVTCQREKGFNLR